MATAIAEQTIRGMADDTRLISCGKEIAHGSTGPEAREKPRRLCVRRQLPDRGAHRGASLGHDGFIDLLGVVSYPL